MPQLARKKKLRLPGAFPTQERTFVQSLLQHLGQAAPRVSRATRTIHAVHLGPCRAGPPSLSRRKILEHSFEAAASLLGGCQPGNYKIL